MFVLLPFRGVYVLRAVLALTVGSGVGFYLNRFGLSLWLAKHRSEHGPATSVDGMLVGAAIGFGIALLPALTSLIGTNHLEEAKSFIILSWIGAAANGACFGAVLGAIGRRHIRWGGSGIQEG
jgi:hypothetical protein